MKRAFIYVVDRDFGFAPNPYHGICTLATCKPVIRKVSNIGDWVVGMGGSRLNATGKCIFAMQVTNKITFNEYWIDPIYNDKKPIRNGSKRMVVGDNIYFLDQENATWSQADSHHSNNDGSINISNLKNDTQTNCVLVSNKFYYFGSRAPQIPQEILNNIGYKNGRSHRNYPLDQCINLMIWLDETFSLSRNMVLAKPFDFDRNNARYSAETNKITH